ncbi:DUF1294 domain-containing protein [Saltatorellus ferox]
MGMRANPIRFTLVPALALGAAGVAVAQSFGDVDPGVGWVLGINLGTYPTWWIDKRQAKRSGFRVPEWTLHLLSMVGGGPAAVLAMRTLRHKTRKRVFQILHPLLAALNVAALGWWLMQ